MKILSLITKIFIALILGILIGLFSKIFNINFFIRILSTFSELFGNFLSFLIPLIIIGFIVPGIASLGKKSGKTLLISTILAYTSTILSGILAFIIGSSLLPNIITKSTISSINNNNVASYFTIDIPPIMNVMTALVFAFILGIGISNLEKSNLLTISQEFGEIISKIVAKTLIPLMPIYILSIFAKLSFNGEIFSTLGSFALVYLLLFFIQIIYLIFQYLVAGYLRKSNPFKLLKNMIPCYLTALGSQSSSATIPVTLESIKKNNVKNELGEFLVPLLATIHLAGDTIALVLSSMAIIYIKGEVPSPSMFIPFIFLLGITMIAAPGIPGGGVISALGLLQSLLGFGSLEKSLIIALHTAQDSFGTATNVTGDGSLAIIVEEMLNRNFYFFKKSKV